MTNSADPDQLASEANWSGSTLFAKAGHIQVQQDKGSSAKQIRIPVLHYSIVFWSSLIMESIPGFRFGK